MYDSRYPILKMNISRNRYLKPKIEDSHVKSIDTKNIGCFAFQYYNRYKIIVATLLWRVKEYYFKDRFNDAGDFNDTINNSRSKKKKGISKIKVGDSMVENPAEVAKHFNSHFCSVGAELIRLKNIA